MMTIILMMMMTTMTTMMIMMIVLTEDPTPPPITFSGSIVHAFSLPCSQPSWLICRMMIMMIFILIIIMVMMMMIMKMTTIILIIHAIIIIIHLLDWVKVVAAVGNLWVKQLRQLACDLQKLSHYYQTKIIPCFEDFWKFLKLVTHYSVLSYMAMFILHK